MEFTRGVRDLGGGLRVLRAHPSLWNWVLAPAIITALLFAGLVVGVLHLIAPITAWLHRHLPAALDGVVTGALTAVVGVALSICALAIFVSVAGILSGPFNEMLSERVEMKLTGRPAGRFSLGEFAHGAVLGVVHGVRRLLASLFGLVLVFLLSAIPVVGSIAAIAYGAWLAARCAAYDCYDAVLARRTLGYRAKLGRASCRERVCNDV